MNRSTLSDLIGDCRELEPITIEPPLPKRQHRNRRYARRIPIPDRAVLKGILFVLRNGIPWNPLPREMGCESSTDCWWRLPRWQQAGIWKRLRAILLAELCHPVPVAGYLGCQKRGRCLASS